VWFSLKDGGLVCFDCRRDHSREGHVVSPGTVASLLHVERNNWPNCLKLRLTPTVRKELKYVLNNFLVFHLGRQLRSAKYLHG
jgi:DNA repair protein RecO (recombination protein O)